MATILSPQAGTVVRLDEVLCLHGTNVTIPGGETFNGIQAQISTGTGAAFVAGIVYDSQPREPDSHAWGGDADEGYVTIEIDVSAIPLASATTYYMRYRDFTSVTGASAYSAEVSFTTETRPSAADWLATR